MYCVAIVERHFAQHNFLAADTLRPEIVSWFEEQFGRQPVISHMSWQSGGRRKMYERTGDVIFDDADEAMFFKLRWV